VADEHQKILELCNHVHSIMQDATRGLPIPDPQNARDARKKLSVFTYGVIHELTENIELDIDEVYGKYLMMGGLNSNQANSIVKRTRDEFTKREFGEECLAVGKDVANKWLAGDKNIQSHMKNLL